MDAKTLAQEGVALADAGPPSFPADADEPQERDRERGRPGEYTAE